MTLSQVATAAAQLASEGRGVSADRILSVLGTGSKRDVLRHLRVLRGQRDPLHDPDLGPGLDPEMTLEVHPDFDPHDPNGPHDPSHFDPCDSNLDPERAAPQRPIVVNVFVFAFDPARLGPATHGPVSGPSGPGHRPWVDPAHDPERSGPVGDSDFDPVAPQPVQRYRVLTPNWRAVAPGGGTVRVPVGSILSYPGDLIALDLVVNSDVLELVVEE